MRKRSLFLAFLFSQFAWPWGNDGHEIVARIAAKHLTDKTGKAVADLLRKDTQVDLPDNPTKQQIEDAMAAVSTWPDHIDKHATGTTDWHFVDIGLLEDQSAIAKRCAAAGSCIVVKITELQGNLKTSAKLGSFEPFEELKFLIHFAGDIHQPLHASTNQDAGGNCVQTKGLGQSELHAVWDTGLVNQVRKAPPGRVPGRSPSPHSLAATSAVAAALDGKISAADRASWSKVVDPRAIALESHQAAIDKAYALLLPPDKKMPGFVEGIHPVSCKGIPADLNALGPRDVTAVYLEPTFAVVRTQLSKAGVRLAQMLNNTFDGAGH